MASKPKKIRLCNHVKASGVFCAAVALKHDDYCYFHRAARERHKRQVRQSRQNLPMQVPLLEDRHCIQIALSDVVNALLSDRLDARKAALILYALQTASSNARDLSIEEYADHEHILIEYSELEQATLQQEIEQEAAGEPLPAGAKGKKDPATVRPRKAAVTKLRPKELSIAELLELNAARRDARKHAEEEEDEDDDDTKLPLPPPQLYGSLQFPKP